MRSRAYEDVISLFMAVFDPACEDKEAELCVGAAIDHAVRPAAEIVRLADHRAMRDARETGEDCEASQAHC